MAGAISRFSDFLSVERGLGPEGRVAVVRFDRGDGINALSPEAMRQLTSVARSFEDDGDTSVVVLTGSAKAFSAGFDLKAIRAAFTLPNSDGSFDPAFHHYLQELGEKRPSVILAFAPKTAGTYLRTAAIVAIGGRLVRTVHAQGGRDATFYLPTFLTYYADQMPATTLVTHVHMQALPANRANG